MDTVQDYRPMFSWEGEDRWSMYNIVIRSDAGFLIDEESQGDSFRPSHGMPNGGYECSVRAWDGEAWTPFSPAVTMVVDAPTVVRTIEWAFNGESISISVDVPIQCVQEHSSDDHSQGIMERVDPYDLCVDQLASGLESVAETMDLDLPERVNLTLAMVQEGIDYRFDISSTGRSEYFRHPVETIMDGEGDCEDKSLLFLSLMAHPWIDLECAAMLLPIEAPTHMAAAIRMDVDWCQPYSIDDGLLFCETVHLGMRLGDVPVEWRGSAALIVPV